MTVKQLNRLLKEFPWLWTFKHEWWPDTERIKVITASRQYFYPHMKYPPTHNNTVWIKYSAGELHGLSIVTPWDTLAESVFYSTRTDRPINYVAIVYASDIVNDLITIFRPPKGQTLREFFHKIMKEERE